MFHLERKEFIFGCCDTLVFAMMFCSIKRRPQGNWAGYLVKETMIVQTGYGFIGHGIYRLHKDLSRNKNTRMKFFIIFLLLSCVGAPNTITRRESLKDGEVIVSDRKRFTFGFFSPGDSKLRYVGIWYNQIPEQTIVWVANRDHPVNDTSGMIKFSSRGNLCLYASVNATKPLWSTSVSVSMLEPTLVARLSDLGNLLLLDPVPGRAFWESFDHPTDTFLPFMKFGFTRKDGLHRFLTSWRSPEDPGSGNFTLRLERRGFPQATVYKGLIPLWGGGSWMGQR